MKSKEELALIKDELNHLSAKIEELTAEELEAVTGGKFFKEEPR